MQLSCPCQGARIAKRSRVLTLVLAVALAGSWLGCDPGSGGPKALHSEPSDHRFQFTRAKGLLVRLDTETGQAWFVPHTGDSDWTSVGGVPDPAGEPSLPGRYRIHNMESSRRTLGDSTQRMLRVDRKTGRAWTIELLDGASWVGISEPDGRALAESVAPEVTPSSSSGAQAPSPRVSAIDIDVVPRETLDQDEEATAQLVQDLKLALEKEGMPPDVQAWSARQLGVFRKEIAVPPLLKALESEHSVVVVSAIHALMATGDASTIPHILKLESHPDPAVRAAVGEVVVEVQ
ncbi:MAG: HEAT repeat domain-containing protein [Deltaproteobacteria bacterium]|nr:HEAT repeat domain-containing protein [Deltaproteobacteria bacterium]MBW2386362.1 HEAT repeat domain-containing protein [Deltaproteobacteria bacterium]MBW2696621.1 HEAT repeat domain-containing protein [Deltaproteobacteria bacterium]